MHKDEKEMKRFLFFVTAWWAKNLLVDYKSMKSFFKEYYSILINNNIVELWDVKDAINTFKNIRLSGVPFSMKCLKTAWLDFDSTMEKLWLTPRELVIFLEKSILEWDFSKLWLSQSYNDNFEASKIKKEKSIKKELNKNNVVDTNENNVKNSLNGKTTNNSEGSRWRKSIHQKLV
jgi:hypothetical protein